MIAPFAGKNREVNAQGASAHERRVIRFQAVPDKFVTPASEPARSFPRTSKDPALAGEEGGSIVMKHIGQHAIVIGASMGGLLAARTLSDFYAVVTVLERDTFPLADIPRKGVPQGRHAHGLLARGRNVIENFFPGWTDEVVAGGGVRGDIAGDVSWIGHGVTIKSAPSNLVGLLAPRPALEGHLRRRLMALPNVRVIENCAVQELIADESRATIRGVRARIGSGAEHSITADLVVDASGRGSASPAWLESFGFAKPEEERIEVGIGYTTRLYRRRPTDLNGKVAVVVAGSGPNWRNGVVLYQAEDRWIVSIGGYFGDHAPDDDQLFAAYAGSLPTSDIYDIVAHAEPLGDFVHYRYPANLRRRYERLAEFPKGYLVFGDALCSFNPVYGQGMTVAAQEATLLHECLDAGAADLARRFFARAAAVIDTPWDIAVGNDLRHPKVEGPRPPKVRFINWYIGKLHMAARRDAKLATAFLEVANLEAPPTRLLQPAVVMRVIRGNLGRGSSEAAPAGAQA
jgi:2-polyprenyl-6-methoxyphenol hydroxylase-like FAD-dependent oxidoreductase